MASLMATPILPQRDIVYDSATRGYAMYLDGDLVGIARTHDQAETTLDELVYHTLIQRPLTVAESLAAELVALHPALSLSDALDIATRERDKIPVLCSSRCLPLPIPPHDSASIP